MLPTNARLLEYTSVDAVRTCFDSHIELETLPSWESQHVNTHSVSGMLLWCTHTNTNYSECEKQHTQCLVCLHTECNGLAHCLHPQICWGVQHSVNVYASRSNLYDLCVLCTYSLSVTNLPLYSQKLVQTLWVQQSLESWVVCKDASVSDH